jgi:hypothetical protein
MLNFFLMISRAKQIAIPSWKLLVLVSTRQTREFSTFRASSALRNSPSAWCIISANYADFLIFLAKSSLWGHFSDTRKCLD